METSSHQNEIVRQFTLQAAPFAAHQAHSEQSSLELLATLAELRGDERVLDSGCGPGLVACFLARRARQVVGVDLTAAMVEQAARTAAAKEIGNVAFLRGNMASLPFSDGEFDAAVTRYTFHHLQNPAAAFAEMVRITRPGGRIVVADAAPAEAQRARYDAFERERDSSHTSAMLTEEIIELGRPFGLSSPQIATYRLRTDLHSLLASSFPAAGARDRLRDLIRADVGKDEIGLSASLEGDRLFIAFPVTVVAWSKP